MNVSSSPMKINDWLVVATDELTRTGIGTARLDCLVLLQDILAKDKSWVLAHPDHQLTPLQLHRLDTLIARRKVHEPLAFIRGRTEFYGRDFTITNDVLEPRPESETMIELLKSLHPSHGSRIVDVGTGSGALGITAALEIDGVSVELIDIDEAALAVACKNAVSYNLSLPIYKSDLLGATKDSDIVLANLPYIPDDYHINEAALLEPHIAIFGGVDGLDLYRHLFPQARELHVRYILTESLPFQHAALRTIAETSGYGQQTDDDFIQVFSSAS
jgi:release factor glutamine methyltransferase